MLVRDGSSSTPDSQSSQSQSVSVSTSDSRTEQIESDKSSDSRTFLRVDARDSLGRTALHHACDVQSQIAALVNVFAEPPPGTTSVLEQRTLPPLRMAADHAQSDVVRALEASQTAAVTVLLACVVPPCCAP
jgi:hypothetical protein